MNLADLNFKIDQVLVELPKLRKKVVSLEAKAEKLKNEKIELQKTIKKNVREISYLSDCQSCARQQTHIMQLNQIIFRFEQIHGEELARKAKEGAEQQGVK